MKEKNSKELEGLISQMLKPLKGLSGFNIIPFDLNDEKDKFLLQALIKVAKISGQNINKKGIIRNRPNEVGNDIEPFVKKALNDCKFTANIPLTINGKHKASGCPDIEFVDTFGRTNYL